MEVEFKTGSISAKDFHVLRTAVGWSSYGPEEIEAGLKNSLFVVVGFLHGKVIAMGRVVGDGKLIFYIQDVIVLPEFQNKGIGRAIMSHLLAYIESQSVNNSIIGLMSATGKEAFYEEFGFTKRPSATTGSGMNLRVKK